MLHEGLCCLMQANDVSQVVGGKRCMLLLSDMTPIHFDSKRKQSNLLHFQFRKLRVDSKKAQCDLGSTDGSCAWRPHSLSIHKYTWATYRTSDWLTCRVNLMSVSHASHDMPAGPGATASQYEFRLLVHAYGVDEDNIHMCTRGSRCDSRGDGNGSEHSHDMTWVLCVMHLQ